MIAMPVPCPDAEALRDFTLGRLSDVAAEPLERHLSGCQRCLQAIQTLEGEDMLTRLMRIQGTPVEIAESAKAVNELIDRLKGRFASGGKRGDSNTSAGFVAGSESSEDGLWPEGTEIEPAADHSYFDFLASAQSPDEIGRLGSYRILGVLGSGGMGIVFQAEDLQLRRPVALKVLRPALAASLPARERFLQEARLAAAFIHDHSVPIYQVGEDHGMPFLAMQLLQGETLEERLKRSPALTLADIRRIGSETADGLAAAHERCLVHRDIKPANIWLEAGSSRVRILDFGLARTLETNSRLTDPGTILGTPEYMAPEQARGESADAQSDLFSLGSVLYTLCSGRSPFQAGSKLATLRAVCEDFPPPVQKLNPEIPDWLAGIIERLHAKDPGARIQSAAEVARFLRQERISSPLALPEPGPRETDRCLGQHAPRKHARIIGITLLSLLGGGLGLALAVGAFPVKQFLTRASTSTTREDSPGQGETTPAALPGNQEAQTDASAPGEAETASQDAAQQAAKVYPLALFSFEERGAAAKELGAKVSDLLFARLSERPELYLVDRQELKKTLEEQELNLSGAVKPGAETQIGQLTGAKLLVTGSIFEVDKKLYLVAKVIGTETSRTAGASANGKPTELESLVEKLADKISQAIDKQADKLVAKSMQKADRVAAVNRVLAKAVRPTVLITIAERHVGQATFDPAAQTEMSLFCKEAGFPVIDPEEGKRSQADVVISGEGISEFATRHGNLVSVKARVEIKAVDPKTDKVLAIDRQTAVVVDLTEQIAAKAALQQASAAVAERMLPKLVKK